MSVPALRHPWKPVAISLALSFLYSAVFAKLGRDWWMDENYSHGLLIPFIIGLILWTMRGRLARAPVRPSLWSGGMAILFAVIGLWAGTAGAELYVQRLSLVLMLLGIVLYFWGWDVLRMLFVPFLLLVLALPIPAIIFNQIAFPLQLFASRCAVWAMRLFDIPVLRQGNIIELLPLGARETKKLEVVEACSGIRSLMTLFTLAVVLAYFMYARSGGDKGDGSSTSPWSRLKEFSFWRAILLVSSAVPIAIMTNAMRVSGTGVLAHYYGTEVANGFFHSFSGWVIYVVAFLLLFAFGWLLDRLANFLGGGPDKGDGGTAAATSQEGKIVKVGAASVAQASAATASIEPISAKGVE